MSRLEIIPETIQLLKMDDEVYFSEKYRDYISNSKLGLIDLDDIEGSVEKYLSGFQEGYNSSFELGSAIHASTLQNDLFYISTFRKPGGKLGIFVEKVLKYRSSGLTIQESINKGSIDADYYSGKLSGTRLKTAIKTGYLYYHYLNNDAQIEMQHNDPKTPIYLSDVSNKSYVGAMKEIANNNEMCKLLNPTDYLIGCESYNEYAILCEVNVFLDDDTVIRLKIKGKLDNFIIDHASALLILNDLKTTSKPVSFFMGNNVKVIDDENKSVWKWFDGSFQKYRYARQMGMYLWLLQCAIQKEFGLLYKSQVNMMVVETGSNFASKVYPVSGKHIKKGLDEMKKLLICVAEWKKNQLIP